MVKIWEIMPKISGDFKKKYSDYNPIVLQLLFNRGLTITEDMKEFLNSDYIKNTHDPYLFKDMEKAVDLVIKHLKNQNKIVIYGDYDVDGITGSALLYEVLKIFKAQVEVYIPDRIKHGYGLNKESIDEIITSGAKLIITVDCGTRNNEEARYIGEKKTDLIITDHHIGDEKNLPNALFLNPALKNSGYPFFYLAGVGAAFKLAKALILEAKLNKNIKEKIEDSILDLVAVGTVADCVSLRGENRVLVKRGLEVLNNTKRIGLQELIKVSQINNKKLDSWNIGFQIGPRINAASRMGHANTAFDLLISKNLAEVKILASRLNDKNIERQKITNEIIEKAEKKISSKKKMLIAVSPRDEVWNEGVIGLVAGRISDKYYRPTLVITETEKGNYKGSGRSITGFNIVEAVLECKDLLDKYGGHPQACGFSLSKDNLDKFVRKIEKVAEDKLKNSQIQPKIKIECELEEKEINEKLIKELEQFAPFGQDNLQPKFLSKKLKIRDIMTVGKDKQHIKFRFNGIWAIAWGQAEEWREFKIGDMVDIVYFLEINEFNGKKEMQLKLIDIKLF